MRCTGRQQGDARRALPGSSSPSLPSASRCTGRARNRRRFRVLVVPAALLANLLTTAPVTAQGFGQWWWDAAVGIEQRSSDSLIDGDRVDSYEQSDLRLSTALHGFVLHPAVGDFRVGLDALLSNKENTADTSSLGFDADLGLFPRGVVPIHLFAARTLFDYSLPAAADPYTLFRAAETTTAWGGDFAIRRGAFQGLSLSVDKTISEFRDTADDNRQRESLRYSRNTRNFRHELRLARFTRDLGYADTGVEDLSVNLNEGGDLSPTWRWSLVGRGARREVTGGGGPDITTETLQIRNELNHAMRERDEITIDTSFGVVRPDSSPEVDSYGLSVFYRWRPGEAWEVAPFTQYAARSSGDLTLRSPRVGATTSWFRRAGALSGNIVVGAGYGRVEQDDSTETMEQSDASYSFSGLLAHGQGTGLWKELEVSAGRNELRMTRDPVFELPDLGLGEGGLGTSDYQRARLSVRRQWDSQHAGGWAEWSSHRSNGSLLSAGDRDALTATAQYGNHVYGFAGNLGQVRATSSSGTSQESRFAAARGFWRPRPYLRLWSSYRVNFRNVQRSSDIDGDRVEAGLTIRIGLFEAEAVFFESEEELVGGEVKTKRGFHWSLKRRFAGGLPILTGTKRRGVIR
jgi:hypothetical protein